MLLIRLIGCLAVEAVILIIFYVCIRNTFNDKKGNKK